jgi:hypothetical protein
MLHSSTTYGSRGLRRHKTEYDGIEYAALPVNCGRIRYHVVLHSNSMLANLPII